METRMKECRHYLRTSALASFLALCILSMNTAVFAQPRPVRRARANAASVKQPLAPPGSYQDVLSAQTRSSSPPVDAKQNKEKSRKVRGDAPCLCWVKAGVPTRAVVLCIHGLGLNSASWQELGKRLSEVGVVTYAIDVRGFGSWMEAKGHKDVDFKSCLADVQSTLQWIRKANPGRPVFLLGESMGGAIALQSTAAFPELVDGLVSACAAGDRFKQKKMDLNVALHVLVPGGFRRDFNVGKSIVKQATDNEELKNAWESDPLNRLKLSPKELLQFQKFMNENHDAAKLITKTPVLMVQGSKDGLVKPEGTEELYAELATPDKELLMVPNAEHLIFEEGQFTDDVLHSVAQWVNKHAQFNLAATNTRPLGGPGLPFNPATAAAVLAGQLPVGGLPANLSGTQASNPDRNSLGTPPLGTKPLDAAALPGQSVPVPAETGAPLGALAAVPLQMLANANKQLEEGKYKAAERSLEEVLTIDPANVDAHYLLGQTYLHTQNYLKARAHFRKVILGARGQDKAIQANKLMMSIPREALAPPRLLAKALLSGPPPLPGGGPGMNGRRQRGRRMAAIGADGQQPTVIVFNAKWCEPGKDMASVVSTAQQKVGNAVKFIQVDVDDPKNESIIEKYSIGPVPTTVFLTASGEVADYTVGYAGVDGMINGLAKIVQMSLR